MVELAFGLDDTDRAPGQLDGAVSVIHQGIVSTVG